MSKEKKINLKKPKKWWVWVLAFIVIANIANGWDKEEVAKEEKTNETIAELKEEKKEEKEETPKQSLLLQGFSQISQYLNFLFFHTSIVLKI
ncbi:hypothetical protein [Peribacillus simplex]|uniref:Uncharacterized protein n=1 Tax=Peribacillus simplex TaxID=1478 RepID=A0AAN2PBZ3_9BACI|nr:hypothetical protein [Peribacillus simplex]CEG24951.1 hypothetical protein BN1180_05796 [Peribacillus simplex]